MLASKLEQPLLSIGKVYTRSAIVLAACSDEGGELSDWVASLFCSGCRAPAIFGLHSMEVFPRKPLYQFGVESGRQYGWNNWRYQ